MGNPGVVVQLPSGSFATQYYTRINPLSNATGASTDEIASGQSSVTVSGVTDAPPNVNGNLVEAILFGYAVVNGLPTEQQIVATSNAAATTDLNRTDSLGNELYSWSVTLPTAGLAPDVYVLQSFVETDAYVETNGVPSAPFLTLEPDTATVTEGGYPYFTYTSKEDTEIVSIGAPQTDTSILLSGTAANTQLQNVQLSTDGRDAVWTNGDQFEEDLQTGATIDVTKTMQPLPTLAVSHSPTQSPFYVGSDPLGPTNTNTYSAYIYPTFTEGGDTFGTISDFDFNPNNGGQNPLPTVTDASGNTAVVSPFGASSPAMVGYAAAASDNGNAVLTIENYNVSYFAYAAGNGTVSPPLYYVTYLSPVPTLTAATVSGTALYNVVQGQNGTDTLSGTSNAIGQAVEIDLGAAGHEAALANVQADGTWHAVFTLSGYTGPATLYISVTSAAGTPARISGNYQVLAPPVVTFYLPTTPSDSASAFIEGNAAPNSTITAYDTTGAVLATTVTRTTGVFIFNGITLTEGTHDVTLTATLNGLTSAASTPLDLVIDLTPPTAKVTSLVVDGTNDLTIADQALATMTLTGMLSAPLAAGETVVVTGPNGAISTAAVGADGLTFTASLPTASGVGSVSAYARDPAGNQSTVLRQSFSFDSAHPVRPIGATVHVPAGLSDNGSIVAFETSIAGVGGMAGSAQVDVTNLSTGLTTVASASLANASYPSLSGDGSRLLVATGSSGLYQLELLNLAAGTTMLVSHAAGTPQTASAKGAADGFLSSDGDHVVFDSASPDIGVTATGVSQVYELDAAAGTTRLVSGAAGVAGNATSYSRGVSIDGSVVVFESTATNLGSAVTGSSPQQVYAARFDASGKESITLVSANAAGAAADAFAENATVANRASASRRTRSTRGGRPVYRQRSWPSSLKHGGAPYRPGQSGAHSREHHELRRG